MEVAINRKRSLASIRIAKVAWDKPLKEFEQLIKHEMVHVLVDPLLEEHEWQTGSKADDRFTTKLERLVEHLAHCL